MDETLDEMERSWSKRLGARRTWIVPGGTEHLSDAFDGAAEVEESLGGVPIACTDIRKESQEASAAGRFLVVDNSLASSFGCPAARLGATLVIESLDAILCDIGSGLIAASVKDEAPEELGPLVASFAERPRPQGRMLEELARRLSSFERRRREASDAAQVAAAYLTCHPAVTCVRYPGLKDDPTYRIAASTLQSGFGPCVDFRSQDLRPDLGGRILCAPGNTWVPGGIASRMDIVEGKDGPWIRLTCGYGDPKKLVLALEDALKR